MHRCFLCGSVLLAAALAAPERVTAQVEVPLSAENGWFVVPVRLDDAFALRFIVDTGASVSAVARSTVERLNLATDGQVTAQGASGPQRLETTRLGTLAVGSLEAWDALAVVVDDETLTPRTSPAASSAPYDGVLGANFFGRFDILLDPVAGVMRIWELGVDLDASDLPPLGPPLPVRRIAGPILGHDVRVNGVTMPAILDSGARRVVLSPRAARVAGTDPIPGTGQRSRSGVGRRSVQFHDVQLDGVDIGSSRLATVRAEVGDLPVFRALGFGDRSVILLGNPLLRSCPVLISYRDDSIRYCVTTGER